jgi:MSHA biogenesis protein MshQ
MTTHAIDTANCIPARQRWWRRKGAALIGAGLLLAPLAVSGAPFTNGSFETGPAPGNFTTLGVGNTSISGWTVVSGSIDYIGSYWSAAQGSRSLDLVGSGSIGGIQQTFDTVAGTNYTVTFQYAGNPACAPSVKPLSVSVAGRTFNYTFNTAGTSTSSMGWITTSFTFTATASSSTLTFISDTSPSNACGAALDNVQVSVGGVVTPPPPVQAFQNGGFELASVVPGQFNTMSGGDTRITGWTVIGNDINYIGTYWVPSEGNRSIDMLGQNSTGGVAQTFATTPGAIYDVQFDLAGNPTGGPANKSMTVSAAGATQTFSFDTTNRSTGSMGWATQTFTFTATGSTTTLSFLASSPGNSNCCWGTALDNVRVTERGSSATSGSFNAFETSAASGSTTGAIQTRVAGVSFSLAVVALNTARTAVDTTFSGSATVQLLDGRDSSGSLDANGCRSSWVAISGATSTVNFGSGSNGRVTATLSEGNAWPDVRVRITSGTSRTGCSSDNFAIRPAALVVAALDADWRTAFTGTGSARTLNNASTVGGVVHAAGSPFTLAATAVNGSGTATSSYSGAPTVASGGLACVLPSGCTSGDLALPGWASAGNGEMRATNVTYSEVGTFTLVLEDNTFAAVDAADTPASQRSIPQSGPLTVGRFVPFTYELQPTGTAPQLRTANTTDASCSAATPGTPRRSFTHVGQPFGFAVRPTAMILPRNAAGALTANYRGLLWKLTADHVTRELAASDTTPPGQPAVVTLGGLAPSDVSSNGDGTGMVLGSALDSITYTRNATAPQAPFTARITAATWITDSSEAGVTGNPATIGSFDTRVCFNGGGTCSAPGTGIAFDSAVAGFPGNEFRYGRLRLANGNGSELIALPVPLQADYWNGTAWVPNSRDFCTTVTPAHLVLSNYQRNLNAGETTPAFSGPLVAGRRSIVFSAPGAGNAGSVDVMLNLSPAGANLPWLQGAWTTTTYDQNPSARVTFGTLAAPSQLIFRRERF